jgi:hypothetical protein
MHGTTNPSQQSECEKLKSPSLSKRLSSWKKASSSANVVSLAEFFRIRSRLDPATSLRRHLLSARTVIPRGRTQDDGDDDDDGDGDGDGDDDDDGDGDEENKFFFEKMSNLFLRTCEEASLKQYHALRKQHESYNCFRFPGLSICDVRRDVARDVCTCRGERRERRRTEHFERR